MRLLILNQYFHPDVAATGQLLTELCQDLAQRHQVTVITGFPTYHPLEQRPRRLWMREHYHGVNVLRVYTWRGSRTRGISRLAIYVTFLVSAFWAGLLVRRPDVVMTWTDPPVIPILGGILSWLRRRPLVVVLQDVYPEVAVRVGALRNPWIIRGVQGLLRLSLRRAQYVVTIGEGMKRRVLEKGIPAEKIVVIPNWADGRAIVPCPKDNPFSRAQGLDRAFVILHAGNIGLVQDFETLLRCAEKLREHQAMRFVFIGDGASKNRLREIVAERRLENVLFLPYQPKEHLRYSLSCGDVAVILVKSGMEGYVEPSKVYAIMASGRPFVAAIGSESEVARIARAHECGRVVPPGDAERLAEALLSLYASTEERARLGRNGRAALLQFYDRSIAVRKYEALLDMLCSRRSSSPCASS